MQIKLSVLATAALLTLVPLVTLGSHQFMPRSAALLPETLAQQPSFNPSQLTPVHPNEPASETWNQRFSLLNALDRVQQIRQALDSFSKLTESSRSQMPPAQLSQLGNTDLESQTLGFQNWVGTVEGTLKKQNYQIKRLELELAEKQYQDGEISKMVLEQKKLEYQQATREMQQFWNTFRIAD